MDSPKISVIVPIYNIEEFLDECLDSIEAQQFDSFEVVLVNDGSTDSSGDIAKARAARCENFRYFETENHGLGAARNFGLAQAKGKYIAFCDSDDAVPPFAYKHLYALAEKHDCDMVIGSVGRFNSQKRMPSRLHRKAFSNLDELVHITTHPQLVYNTTTWNNLYSHEFLTQTGFQFPEGMLFEDIPVIVPLQYRAKTVAFLDEVVYMWRIRDKESLSITQDKAAAGALEGRIRAMKMTDDFFEENVTEQALTRAKNRKWLSNDLMLYIRVLPELEDEQRREEMRGIILDFADSVDPAAYNEIEALDRIAYHFLREGDYDRLRETLEFKSERYDEAKGTLGDDGRFYGSLGFDDLGQSFSDMTWEIAHNCLQTSIDAVALGEDGFTVEGTLKMRGVKTGPDDRYELDLCLHSIESAPDGDLPLEVTSLDVRPAESEEQDEATIFEGHFVAGLSHEQLAKLGDGTYKLIVDARFNGLPLERITLKNPSRDRKTRPFAYLCDGRISTVLYNTLLELKLSVEKLASPVITRMADAEGHFEATDANGAVHQIAYDEIDLDNHRIGDPMDRKYYFLAVDPITCTYQDGILRMSRISSGQPYMTLFEKAALILDAHLEGTMLTLAIEPSRSLGASGELRYVFTDPEEETLPSPILTSVGHDGLHLLEIDLRKLSRHRVAEKGLLSLHVLDESGEKCPLMRYSNSCKKMNETVACKGREYELIVKNAGFRMKAKTTSKVKKRWESATDKAIGKR